MNNSVYRNTHQAAMLKSQKNNAAGTFSSEERNNSDDLDELPSVAASEGDDDTYEKKPSNINYYKSIE